MSQYLRLLRYIIFCKNKIFICCTFTFQAVEKFTSNTDKVSDSISKLIKKMETVCTPNDVAGTEKQILEHTKQRQELAEDIESSVFHGKTLLRCIKGDEERTPLVHVTHVLAIER